MAKWAEQGHEVHYAAFSAAEESVPAGLPQDILRTEIEAAAKEINLPASQLQVSQFRVRHFPRDGQEVLEAMVRLRKEIDPEVVVGPNSYDTHQDHEVINREAFRAFKRATILVYEIPWNNRRTDLTFFHGVEEEHLQCQIRALAAHKSQAFRAPNYDELIHSLAVQRGCQIGIRYAGAFEVIRWVEQ